VSLPLHHNVVRKIAPPTYGSTCDLKQIRPPPQNKPNTKPDRIGSSLSPPEEYAPIRDYFFIHHRDALFQQETQQLLNKSEHPRYLNTTPNDPLIKALHTIKMAQDNKNKPRAKENTTMLHKFPRAAGPSEPNFLPMHT